MFNKSFSFALAILIGTTIGAGIFAIPYVVARSGIIPGLFYFLILGGAVLLLHLFFGEIVLRTKEKHRLIGYSQKYLGNWAKILITVSMVLAMTGTLLAYIIIGGDFLKIVFAPFFEISGIYLNLFFWAVLSYFIFRGIKLIAPAELLMNILLFLVILFIFLFALPKLSLQNFALVRTSGLFLPYGVILFAFSAWVAIPEAAQILKTSPERKKYKNIIIWGSILAFLLYLLFTLAVIGVSGETTSEEALQGLVPFLGQKIIILGAIFGVISIASSFLVLGNYFKNALVYDYHFPKFWAATIACGTPLVLFLIGLRGFVETIGFVGTLIGVIEGIIIILIFKKIRKLGNRKPEYSLKIPQFLLYFLIAVFILGAVSQIIYFIK